jgi:anti-sigma factor RsiW
MHLYDDTLEKYLVDELPPSSLAAIDAHVSNCLFCAHTLAQIQQASARWERRGLLRRLVRVAEPHTPAVLDDNVRAEAA